MSLVKCDVTGSDDRVERVHNQLLGHGIEHVCFSVGVKLEQLRADCLAKYDDYEGFDKAEKIESEIAKALKLFLGKKPEAKKPEIKQDAYEVKDDDMAKKKKKPYKKKK